MKFQRMIQDKFLISLLMTICFSILPMVAAAQEKIAFSSERDGFAPEIYTMNPDGTGQMRLTNNSTPDTQPSFSPDGSKIAFVRFFDIYVMNADGSNQTQLTANPSVDQYPSFSPDGAKIVFTSFRDGNGEIYVINADGTQETRLTNNSAQDSQPEFSRDGSKIVFVSSRDGNDEIYVMNVNGTDPARLTNNPARDFDPTFNHDDSKIAFTSQRDVNDDVFLMNADGSAPTNLTNNTLGSHFDPAFSPDGSQIVFTSSRESGDLEIYVMNADGTLPTRLTNASREDRNPSWGGSPINPPSAPVLSNVLVTSPISENSTAALSGNISDADAGDAFTLTVNWGDGSAPQVFNYPAGTTSFSETHQYLDDNPTATASDSYTINLSLDDNGGGGSDTDSTTVTVNNSAPVLSGITANPSTVAVGGTTTLSGSVSDPGTLDTHTIQINWGDGSPVTTLNLAAGAGGFSATHQYNSVGSFAISVTATDDDGGTASGGANVNSNPTTAPNAPSNLRVVTVGANEVSLAWNDNSDNESGFIIERCRSKNCSNFVQVGQTSANATTFTDTNLFSSVHYYYRVRAVNIVGSSGYSNTVGIKTLK